MTARKACLTIATSSFALSGVLLAVSMLADIQGVPFAVSVIGFLVLMFLGLDALWAAFRARPGQVLADDLLSAILRLLLDVH